MCVCVCVFLCVVVPGVIDARGHVPRQLQMFGGLQFASDLDSVVTSFRNIGSWQVSLPSPQRESREPCDLQATRVTPDLKLVSRVRGCAYLRLLASAVHRSPLGGPFRSKVSGIVVLLLQHCVPNCMSMFVRATQHHTLAPCLGVVRGAVFHGCAQGCRFVLNPTCAWATACLPPTEQGG